MKCLIVNKQRKYRLLDLCCKAGGAGEGYRRAGFEVVGVDKEPQPNNPHEFIQMDMFKAIKKMAKYFDVIHASPPCQNYSVSTAPFRKKGKKYPDLLAKTRDALMKTGKPFVLENVMSAPLRKDIVLRGDVFGLKVLRSRIFEINGFFLMQPLLQKIQGSCKEGDFITVAGKGSYKTKKHHAHPKFDQGNVFDTWAYAMGIDWMKEYTELSNAIPPAYTEWIGKEIIRQLDLGIEPKFQEYKIKEKKKTSNKNVGFLSHNDVNQIELF